jgi:hypothetical protein
MSKYDKYINDDLMRKIYRNKLEKLNNDNDNYCFSHSWDRKTVQIHCSDDEYKKEIDKGLLNEFINEFKKEIDKYLLNELKNMKG